MRKLLAVTILLAATVTFAQEHTPRFQRPVNTYSIVARDAQTGEFGAAVQSHWFCVGCIVIWAEAGVGAVATQSFVDPSYGKLGLEMMKVGRTAPETLKGLLEADQGNAVRQVAMIDREGRVAVWTGAKDIAAAGHIAGGAKGGDQGSCGVEAHSNAAGCFATGVGYSVQANLMENDKVWPAMAKAFESAQGDLAERMLAALEAAQSVGGDIRGKQSAALIVVSGKPSGKPWVDRTFDLRVDDSPEPLKELRRLVAVNRAYNHMNAGDLAVEHKDNEGALREYAAAEKIASTTPGFEPTRLAEMKFWHAVALVNMGRVEDSLPVFAEAFKIHPLWRDLVPRLPKSGLLPDDKKVIQRIVGVGKQ